jgi:hypothetical protein
LVRSQSLLLKGTRRKEKGMKANYLLLSSLPFALSPKSVGLSFVANQNVEFLRNRLKSI